MVWFKLNIKKVTLLYKLKESPILKMKYYAIFYKNKRKDYILFGLFILWLTYCR